MTVIGRFKGGAVLVAALAGGQSYVEAAVTAGYSERTVRRRMADQDFRRQVADAKAEILAQAVTMLTSASVEAVEALRGLLTSDLDFAKLAAARAILEVGIRLREQVDLSDRIASLEAQIGNKEGSTWRRAS